MKRFPVVLAALFSLRVEAAVNVPLTVEEALYSGGTTGVARTNEPFCMGVPLPDSAAVQSTGALGLTGATAGQFRILGTWSSGNAKWLKTCGIIPSLIADGATTVTLTDAGSGNFGGPNLATDNGATITVTTGSATFTVRKANFNVIDQAVIGSTTVVSSGSSQGLVLIGPSATAAYPGNVTCGTCTTVYSSANDTNSTATIEENGPVMTVIKATGDHVDGTGHIYMHFTVRLYFYLNKNYVKVTSILRNADYGASNTFATAYKGFESYELRVSPNITGTLNYSIAADPTACSSGVCKGTLNQSGGTDSAYIYQGQSNLMTNASLVLPVNYTPDLGYSVAKNGVSQASGDVSHYPSGWADISDSTGKGVEIGVYQMAAYWPKSLEFDAGGGDVRIGIWPRQNSQPVYMAWPQASIHDLFLNFHASSLASAGNDFLRFQHYLVGFADRTQYNSAGVFFYNLIDPAEEDAFYKATVAAGQPTITNYTYTVKDLGLTDINYRLSVYRNFRWGNPGGGNQMEFHWSGLLNLIRRGFTGAYVDAAHFYRMVSEKGFPLLDGDSWKNHPADLNGSGFPGQTSTNSTLAFQDWADEEHKHWYGMPDYYFMTGDETIREAIAQGPTDRFTSSNPGLNPNRGALWNSRDLGNQFMGAARLYQYYNALGDTASANAVAAQSQNAYNKQVKAELCVSGYPVGCSYGSLSPWNLTSFGTSRTRGIHYAWSESDPTCGTTDRINTAFQDSILLEGIWELRSALGPGWSDYANSLDLAYGISNWSLTEDYLDDGTGSWSTSGFRYYLGLDVPNNVPQGCAAQGRSFDYYSATNSRETVWFPFFIQHAYKGTVSDWLPKFNVALQKDAHSGATDEFGHFTIAAVIDQIKRPGNTVLVDVPLNTINNGGGSYTLSWSAPAGAQSYVIKTGTKQIVNWIGFDAGNNQFTGDPVHTMAWFAADTVANPPSPALAGTMQQWTVAGMPATGQFFAVKAFVAGGSTGLTAPTVSITAPSNGASVSGTTPVTATASSSAGMAGVQFQVDRANLGTIMAGGGPSYSVSWDTTKNTNGSHTLSAIAMDTAGNTATTSVSVTISNSSALPVISAVAAGAVTSSSATITWITNTLGDSQVAYGTTASYGSLSGFGASLLTLHSLVLSGLSSSTTYHYKVQSRDALGNLGSSADFTFTTAASSGGSALPLGTWTMIPTLGFPAQVVGWEKLVYSPAVRKSVMLGNYHESGSEPNRGLVAYDFASNRWDVLEVGGLFHTENMPEAGHTAGIFGYDPVRNVFITYCCESGSMQPENVYHTWWFDPVGQAGRDEFTAPKPGLNPLEASAAYDSTNNKFILMGSGFGTWSYDPSSNSWKALTPSKVVQGAGTFNTQFNSLGMHSMAYDSANHKIYLFGGRLNYGIGQTFYNDLYTYDVATNTWTLLSPSGAKPSPRQKAGFAYDSTNNVFLLFGGYNDSGLASPPPPLTDTWIYNPVANTWTQLSPPQSPSPTGGVFERLVYDSDDNVFIMAVGGQGGYAGGKGTGYAMQTWLFRYQGSGPGPGSASTTYRATGGSINRNPAGWANEPVLASSGSNVFAAWVETGAPYDSGLDTTPHIYANQLSGGAWSMLGSSFASVNSEAGGNGEWFGPSIAYAGGVPWVSYSGWHPTLGKVFYAKSWNGSSWQGGVVGTVHTSSYIGRSQLIDAGGVPNIAYIESDKSFNPQKALVYVRSWNGSQWVLKGAGPLNRSTATTLADSVSVASDGSNPYVAWTEYISSDAHATTQTNPQVYVSHWNGSQWVAAGGSLNINPSTGWAFDVSIAFVSGQPYVAWTERSQSGNAQLYVKTLTGSSWVLVGSGALNKDSNTGWAFRPSLASDGSSLYLGWVEQQALGQRPQAYVSKYSGGTWTPVGASLNADSTLGGAQRISVAVLAGQPVAAWGEVNFGSVRQVFVKQWNGSQWGLLPGPTMSTGGSCDLNSDGVVNVADVQLAIVQVLGPVACTTADLQGTGQCSIVDVQRVINAALGGSCVTGP